MNIETYLTPAVLPRVIIGSRSVVVRLFYVVHRVLRRCYTEWFRM